MVQVRSVKAVPRVDGTEVPVLDWFDDPAAFGDGFAPMRRSVSRSVCAFVDVGLKAEWNDGAWSVRVVFMDHELTNIIGKRWRHFHPRTALAGMYQDYLHILGGHLGRKPRPGSLAVLADIYRIDAAGAVEGRAHLVKEMQRAYRKTLERLPDEKLRSHFLRTFIDPLLAWDEVIGIYRKSRVGARQRSQWKGQMRRVMLAHGLDEALVQEYRRAIHRHRLMLLKCPYLFDAGGGA